MALDAAELARLVGLLFTTVYARRGVPTTIETLVAAVNQAAGNAAFSAEAVDGIRTGNRPRTMASSMPDLDPAMIKAVLGRSAHSAREEREAELVASLIVDRAIASPRRPTQDAPKLNPVTQRLQRTFGG